MAGRIWEIDCARGIAIVLMIAFHLVVDLKDFYDYPISYLSGFWYYEGKASAIMFIFLAGLSSTLCRSQLKRGLTVLLCALGITIVTYIYNADTYIRFGILHLLGSCMLLFHYIGRLSPYWLLTAGTLLIAAGPWTAAETASSVLLIPLGITPSQFVSLDYYPLVPWSGIFFYGAAFGKTVYRQKQTLLPYSPLAAPLTALGRRSLFVYIVHQPVLLALLWVYHLR